MSQETNETHEPLLDPNYQSLVQLIRSEFELAIKPLRDDIHTMQVSSYTKEVLDLRFKGQDERIAKLEQGWSALVVRIGAVASLIYVLLNILGIHVKLF